MCSIQKLLSELGWETLQERRSKHKLVIFYKIINRLTPDYLSDLLPPIVQDNVTYNLRNANNMRSLRACTNLYFNSFFPSTIRAWNKLPDEIKGASTVSAFKYQLNKHQKPPPMYFHAGTRKGQILHTRIRMECSSLNSHLYSKILSTVRPVLVEALKALVISFLYAQYTGTQETYICLMSCKRI